MRSRVTEPTAALAALISGNHRVVARRRGADPGGVPSRLANAFAIVCAIEALPAPAPELFDADPAEVLSVTLARSGAGTDPPDATDPYARVDALVVRTNAALLVIVGPLTGGLEGESELGFRVARERAMAGASSLLHACPSLRDRVERQDLRVVAALVGHDDFRVHWLGEHPEQASVLKAFRSRA